MKPDRILPCACSQLNHIVRISSWDDAPDHICIEFLLEPHGFWMRLKQAWAVLRGRRALLQDVVVDGDELREWLKPSLGPGIALNPKTERALVEILEWARCMEEKERASVHQKESK